MVESSSQQQPSRLQDAAAFLALASWIFGLLLVALWFILTVALLPVFPLACTTSLAVLVGLWLLPLDIPPPRLACRFLAFSLKAGYSYFPVKVVFEDRAALENGHPFVVGYEPHGVLPQGMSAFSSYPGEPMPAGLANTRICASSALFAAPIMRHLAWWLGCQPAGKREFSESLAKGATVLVCPGGVQECLYMRPGGEVAYLRKRLGFVRMAMQHGAPLVPVFAFGQSHLYSYVRPFIDVPRPAKPSAAWARIVRRLGFVPLIMWGPWRLRVYIVVGRPIAVPRVSHPSDAQVEKHLGEFIEAMEQLFVKHKAAAGYPAGTLEIY